MAAIAKVGEGGRKGKGVEGEGARHERERGAALEWGAGSGNDASGTVLLCLLEGPLPTGSVDIGSGGGGKKYVERLGVVAFPTCVPRCRSSRITYFPFYDVIGRVTMLLARWWEVGERGLKGVESCGEGRSAQGRIQTLFYWSIDRGKCCPSRALVFQLHYTWRIARPN